MTSADRPPHRTTSLLRRRAIALSCATLVWVGGLAAAAGPASAAVPSPSSAVPAAVTDAPPSQLQDAAETAVAAGIVGYLARVDDGTRVTKAAAGLADRETGRKLDPGDQFEIGSNTKTFMAVVALQLVADG